MEACESQREEIFFRNLKAYLIRERELLENVLDHPDIIKTLLGDDVHVEREDHSDKREALENALKNNKQFLFSLIRSGKDQEVLNVLKNLKGEDAALARNVEKTLQEMTARLKELLTKVTAQEIGKYLAPSGPGDPYLIERATLIKAMKSDQLFIKSLIVRKSPGGNVANVNALVTAIRSSPSLTLQEIPTLAIYMKLYHIQ